MSESEATMQGEASGNEVVRQPERNSGLVAKVHAMLERTGCASVEQLAQAVPGEPGESLRVRERRVKAALKALGAHARIVGGLKRMREVAVGVTWPACSASTLWSLKPWRSQRVCRADRPIAAPAVGKASSEGGSAAR